jgi:hypothetical protein
VAIRDFAQTPLIPLQQGAADILPPPPGEEVDKVLVHARTFQLLLPPDAAVPYRLAIYFGEEHVLVGIAVGQVAVVAGNVLYRRCPLGLVLFLGADDDAVHDRIVSLAAERTNPQTGGSRRISLCFNTI